VNTPPPNYTHLLRAGTQTGRGERRAARRHLAQVIRERVPPDAIVEQLWSLASGDEPGMVRLAAMRVLLDRGWGRAPQLLHVEAGLAEAATGEEGERALEEVSDAELVAAVELGEQLRRRLALPGV
jgi:hypothetical protein